MTVINDKVTCMSLSKNVVSPAGRSSRRLADSGEGKPKKSARQTSEKTKAFAAFVVVVVDVTASDFAVCALSK